MRRYTPADYPMLCAWYEAYGQKPPAHTSLPLTGIVIDGVCAAFLYKTDSDIAMIEGVIANRDAKTLIRGRALCAVLSELFKIAKEQGFSQVYGFTQHSGVPGLAAKVGGVQRKGAYTLLVKDLE